MNTHPRSALPPDFDLTQLNKVPLAPHHSRILKAAESNCGGGPQWRNRKRMEAHEVLALAQVSRRLVVLGLDLREAIRIHFLMRAPVPCLPDPDGQLQIEPFAELGLIYPECALVDVQPGHSFASLLRPLHAWIPSVSAVELGQRICLGQLPAATRVREIILLLFQVLTLSEVQFDPRDALGIMNRAAGEWYQRNPSPIPLTKETFIIFGETDPAGAKEK
jgi:hypothetical protein